MPAGKRYGEPPLRPIRVTSTPVTSGAMSHALP